MLDYISRPSDVYSFVSQDGATLVPPFSCAYNNGMAYICSSLPGCEVNNQRLLFIK